MGEFQLGFLLGVLGSVIPLLVILSARGIKPRD